MKHFVTVAQARWPPNAHGRAVLVAFKLSLGCKPNMAATEICRIDYLGCFYRICRRLYNAKGLGIDEEIVLSQSLQKNIIRRE
jgi:hypothetical protein